MKKIILAGSVLFSMTFAMCNSSSNTFSSLTKKQKLEINNERISAESKADSAADKFVPLKRELENKLEANSPNIGELRKKYQVEYGKWSGKKTEFTNTYRQEILNKYGISEDVFSQVCEGAPYVMSNQQVERE